MTLPHISYSDINLSGQKLRWLRWCCSFCGDGVLEVVLLLLWRCCCCCCGGGVVVVVVMDGIKGVIGVIWVNGVNRYILFIPTFTNVYLYHNVP